MWLLKKGRPYVLLNISIVAISAGLPVAVNNPVPASQVGFQQIRGIWRFCVEDSNKRSDPGHSSNDLEFFKTVLSEGHFRIFANWLTLSILSLATMGEGPSQVT